MKRELTPDDILSNEAYEKIRADKRAAIMACKKKRRVSVGPYVTFLFENYDTMWLQVQEMLRIEKGGAAQMQDELAAYNPLVPKGNELVATVMFEIEDAERRTAVLSALGGVEHKMQIKIGNEAIIGEPERDLEYTSPEGKASSVLFAHFRFTPAQIAAFRKPETEVVLAILHPGYSHMAILPPDTKRELAEDFN